jgi:hypothetical protein
MNTYTITWHLPEHFSTFVSSIHKALWPLLLWFLIKFYAISNLMISRCQHEKKNFHWILSLKKNSTKHVQCVLAFDVMIFFSARNQNMHVCCISVNFPLP